MRIESAWKLQPKPSYSERRPAFSRVGGKITRLAGPNKLYALRKAFHQTVC